MKYYQAEDQYTTSTVSIINSQSKFSQNSLYYTAYSHITKTYNLALIYNS